MILYEWHFSVYFISMMVLLFGFLFCLIRLFVVGRSIWNMSKFNLILRGAYFFCVFFSVGVTIRLIVNIP